MKNSEKLSRAKGSIVNLTLTIIIIVLILGAFSALCYTIVNPPGEEKFTEFYILGLDQKARDYPYEFMMYQGKVWQVNYGAGLSNSVSGQWGEVTVGIVNHEQQNTQYWLAITINEKEISFNYQGTVLTKLGRIELMPGQKWEQKIGFAPQNLGADQLVHFILYEGTVNNRINTLSLHITANE